MWPAPAQRFLAYVVRRRTRPRNSPFSFALLSPSTSTAVMPSGLKGALLGFGNPLLDISAGARCFPRRCLSLPPFGRAARAACGAVSGAALARIAVGLFRRIGVHGSLCAHAALHRASPRAVVPKSMLDKYDLKPGNAILAEDKHLPLYKARLSTGGPGLRASAVGLALTRCARRSWLTTSRWSTSPAVPRKTRSAWRSGCCRFPAQPPILCVALTRIAARRDRFVRAPQHRACLRTCAARRRAPWATTSSPRAWRRWLAATA